MRGHTPHPSPAGNTEPDRVSPGSRGRLFKLTTAGIAVAVGLFAMAVTIGSASAADNPYQRGPDPTRASVAAVTGPFANASVSVPTGYGFNGGRIYYPTDTSQGTFGAIAISPGYTALFSAGTAGAPSIRGIWLSNPTSTSPGSAGCITTIGDSNRRPRAAATSSRPISSMG